MPSCTVSPRKPRRLARSAAVGITVTIVMTGLAIPMTASADPAPAPAPVSYTTPGSFSTTVPDGVCRVTVDAVGGAGGSATPSASWNGAGARVRGVYSVQPGQSVAVTVAAGGEGKASSNATSGTPGVGGAPGGARGGLSGGGANTSNHAGAGGGGYSELSVAGATLVLAGGGGGSSGGHATAGGRGGDAGLPVGPGVAAGSAGQNGFDGTTGTPSPGGGGGGTATGPGAGGVHSTTSTLDGFPGSGRAGGVGGVDPNSDTAGGGGGGWFGGGGGASTGSQGATANPTNGPAGGGGGGGASYLAPVAPDGSSILGFSSSVGPRLAGTGVGANGSVAVSWGTCLYDLAVAKRVTPTKVVSGSLVTWTVDVTNTSVEPMTRGDLVSLTDSLPGGGATSIVSIATTGGTPTANLASGPMTCSAGPGAAMAATLTCGRPYVLGGGAPDGRRGLDAGETLTIVYSQAITGAPGDYLNTATVTDRARTDNTAEATVTIAPDLDLVDDSSTGNVLGAAVTVPVLGNDAGSPVPGTVRLLDGATPVSSLDVPGQGRWTVDPTSGAITFTPEPGYAGTPTPVSYTAQNSFGQSDTATVAVSYAPEANDDQSLLNPLGTTVLVPVLGNDRGVIVPGSVRLLDGGTPTSALTVPGEGTWRVDPATDRIGFTPDAGFTGNPTPISYQVEGSDRTLDVATVTVTYRPEAAGDVSNGNEIGTTVIVDVLANDSDNLVPGSVRILDGGTPVSSLAVPGQGTWSVDPASGAITFAPEPGFTGNPDQIRYRVEDAAGTAVVAGVEVRYTPVAEPDSSLGNTIGDEVRVDVLANDSDNLSPSTVRILDGADPVTSLTVPGEGTWSVDPVTGAITFAPEPGFLGSPTPIRYEARGIEDTPVSATVTVTYAPAAVDDAALGNAIGTRVTVDVLANDRGDFDPTSVRLLDGGGPVPSLTVPGEGTWSVDPTSGAISFVPEAGFTGDPTPVRYQVTDAIGQVATADVTVGYVPEAVDDTALDIATGAPAVVDVLANDVGSLDPASVRFAANGGTTLLAPGQGTWSIDPATGSVTFTPLVGFRGNPDPVIYRATDATGDTVQATVTVTYIPVAEDDVSTGNVPGAPVTVAVLGNDLGSLDIASLRIIDPATGQAVLSLAVAGEGVWRVNPDGTITFTPEPGFTGGPTSVRYQVANLRGVLTSALVSIDYLAVPPTAGPAAPAGSGGLARTGTELLSALAVGGALVIGGLGILIVRRRPLR